MTTSTSTAPNTSRARDQFARLRATGWRPRLDYNGRRNTTQVDDLLAHFEALDLDAPASLADQLTPLANAYEQVDALTSRTPAAFTLDDLAADDAADRFDAAILADLAAERAHKAAERVREQVQGRIPAVTGPALDPMFDTLAAHYLDNAEAFHGIDDTGLTGAERDRREHLHKHLRAAASWLWMARPGGHHDDGYDGQEWVLWFEWTPEAWRKLVNRTGPGYRIVTGNTLNRHTIALECGATPRLVESYQAAETAALALVRNR